MPDDELIAELRGLGTFLEVPDAADQRAAVRDRLRRSVRQRRRVRGWIAAVVAAVAGTIVAVAPARAAVVDVVGGLLRAAGIEVNQESAPLPAHPSPLPSLRSTALDEARRVALFPVRVPAALGAPDRVQFADQDASGAPRVVTLIYRGGAVRLDQFDGRVEFSFLKTTPDAEPVILSTDVLGAWLPKPHAVTYVGRDGQQHTETARLATPTLIWIDGSVTYRLEGLTNLDEARAVALSLR
ncbi:hypothetical protein HH310_06145 [Actinoplanes sp. TBRC 11911]|uniref:hypothetical protein n=1 Tax=Actinoplanes sp. TBRC 11911 TaxID=2729386 RepID=UPI00145F7585|nr:hypothetical protein [Actinoplanes sp. TBRC 11911]NMO50774.1 hypothetical protein [Actinoplanes sp. TBRC 11911]